MRIIDVLKGTGTVVSKSGSAAAQYNLEVYEDEIRGWIRPISGQMCEELTLRMQDGTSLSFCFIDRDGAVTALDGIISTQMLSMGGAGDRAVARFEVDPRGSNGKR